MTIGYSSQCFGDQWTRVGDWEGLVRIYGNVRVCERRCYRGKIKIGKYRHKTRILLKLPKDEEEFMSSSDLIKDLSDV